MSKKLFFLLLGVIMCSCDNKIKSSDNLIPRDVLFGNPEKVSPQISPDGKKLAYIAPVNNVLNVWVGDLDDAGNYLNPVPVTSDTNRGVRGYSWSPDSSQILYTQDKDGDESWHLFGTDINTKVTRNYLKHDDKRRITVVDVNKKYPDTILISMNKENPKFHDVYKLNLKSGNLEMIYKNPGYVEDFVTDHDQNIKAIVKANKKDSSKELLVKKGEEFVHVLTWSDDESTICGPVGFAKDLNYIYLKDARDSDTSQLIKLNINNLEAEILLSDPKYDISGVTIDGDTHEILWATVVKDKRNIIFFDKNHELDYENLKRLDTGEIHVLGFDDKKEKMVVAFMKDNGPVNYYFYNRLNNTAKFLFENKPDLKKYKLAHMEPISFKSRDGIEIHGYLTLPVDKEPKQLPLVLDVHGGPTVRDTWGYDGQSQWLANRGYAVLQVNYRGSRGYGKNFINIGDREWGGKMHDDLIDAVNWAAESGIADKNKIAIYGGSYGGYAALCGATFTPDVFCCAVDIVGPSNLVTLLNSIPDYWEAGRAELYKRIGHPEKDKEFIESRSPLFKVDNIKIPILIAQGKHDPRVKQAEAEQIVAAMKAKNIPHEYMLFEDEGHGFAKPQNRIKFYTAAEKFLAQNLGGRYEQ